MSVKDVLSSDLKRIRTSKIKTQAEMSELTGLSVRTISNIENNRNVSLADFLLYADALGYTMELKKKENKIVVIDTTWSETDE